MKRRRLCPHCGREVLKNAAFCPYCGFDLTKTICEGCLKKVDLSLDTCPYCGTQLRKEVIVPEVLNLLDDERYKIVEVKDGYTVLREDNITLEKYKPVSLEDFFYTSQGIYYDLIFLDEDKRLPVLLPTYPVSSLKEYWDILKNNEKVRLIFEIANRILKHSKLYFSSSGILFDADGRLIVNVSEVGKEGYLSAVAWLKEFYRALQPEPGSFFHSLINSEEFDGIQEVTDLVNYLYASFSEYAPLEIDSFAMTSQGLVRGHNEDNYMMVEFVKHGFDGLAPSSMKVGLYIVSDGMGGHRGGEEASRLIVKVIAEEILSYLAKEHVFFDLAPVIGRAITRANSVVYQKNTGAKTEREKMGATVVGLLVSGDEVWYFNVGDSSIMLHDGRSLLKVSVDDVMFSNKKALTQAVGVVESDKLNPHISKYRVEENLKFLLCSDGLTDLVKFSEIEDVMKEGEKVKNSTQKLLSLALSRGGIDNITIIMGEIRRNRLF